MIVTFVVYIYCLRCTIPKINIHSFIHLSDGGECVSQHYVPPHVSRADCLPGGHTGRRTGMYIGGREGERQRQTEILCFYFIRSIFYYFLITMPHTDNMVGTSPN